jgi:hypothetical protein
MTRRCGSAFAVDAATTIAAVTMAIHVSFRARVSMSSPSSCLEAGNGEENWQ